MLVTSLFTFLNHITCVHAQRLYVLHSLHFLQVNICCRKFGCKDHFMEKKTTVPISGQLQCCEKTLRKQEIPERKVVFGVMFQDEQDKGDKLIEKSIYKLTRISNLFAIYPHSLLN